MSSACRLTTLEPNRNGSPPVDARTLHSLSGSSLIGMRGLGKHVSRGAIAVRGMTLTARKGGIVNPIGLSGCGKSALLKVIAGSQSHSARTGTVNGRPPDVCGNAIFVSISILEFVCLPSQVVMAARPGHTVYGFDLPGDYPPAPNGSGHPATRRNGTALSARQWMKHRIIPVTVTEAIQALAPPRASRLRRNLHTVLPVLALLVALCLREFLVRYDMNPHVLIPSPCLAAATLVRDIVSIGGSMWFTMSPAMAASGLAIVGGILAGTLLTLSLKAKTSLFPFKNVPQATPVVWIEFPVSIQASNARAAPLIRECIAAFIPILSSTVTGLRSAEHGLRGLFAQSGHVSGQQVHRLLVPSAHPNFLAALEVVGALSLICAAVAELVADSMGQDAGLVSLMLESGFRNGTPRVTAVLLLVSLPVIVICLITSWLSRPVLVHRHETEWKTEG